MGRPLYRKGWLLRAIYPAKRLGAWATGTIASVNFARGVLVFMLSGAGSARAADAEALELFERRVRPLLVEHCEKCHSEKSGKRKGGLWLDRRTGWEKGGDSGPALVPGKPDESLLIKAVRHKGTDSEMPPDGKLAPDLIAALEAWVKAGAPDPRTGAVATTKPLDFETAKSHWSLQPPRDVAAPACADPVFCKNGIDGFVLAKLTAEGLHPATPADRRTLIRRATFDLWGLPPTADEVDVFSRDASPRAFEKLVDRLLASPRYGERWGRHWLDVARYADTKGYVFKEERRYSSSFTYRDWVVRALNQDLPYDKFLIRQIAADRLVDKTNRQDLAALGFLTLGRRFLNRVPDIIDDRIDVITRGTMGLTLACARCHDHKFDPLSTKDYYAMYGVLASSQEPKELPIIGRPSDLKAMAAYDVELQKRQIDLSQRLESLHESTWRSLQTVESISAYLEVAAISEAKNPDEEKTALQKAELSPLVLDRFRSVMGKDAAFWAPWHAVVNTSVQPWGPATFSAWTRACETAKGVLSDDAAALLAPPPDSRKALALRYAQILARADLSPALRTVLVGKAGPLFIAQADLKQVINRKDREALQALEEKIDVLHVTHPGAPLEAHAIFDSEKPANGRIFIRGNPDNPGDEVKRRFLTILGGEKTAPWQIGSGRLELAQAIASPQNPLTARVLVNRVWAQHFGAGLVRTPSDFGTRGDPPTHPELLDWMARRFVETGWSQKRLHKLLLLSGTYQQASDADAKARAKDPLNLWVGRQNRRRLDFEAMRDTLLFASGNLDNALGGRAVPFVDNPNVTLRVDGETLVSTGGGDPSQDRFAHRRSVYLFVDRQNLPGLFRDFDFANPDTHSPKRFQTSVPQQALFLLNSPFLIEQARAVMARPEIAHQHDPERRAQMLHRILYGRVATASELDLARRFLASEEGRQATDPMAEVRPAWQYGYGRVDTGTRKVAAFTALPHFSGTTWQGGMKLPDTRLGWALLSASGGHPGNDSDHAVIRRWVAPRDGEVAVAGQLTHANDQGDGILAQVVSSRAGTLASFTVHNNEAETKISRVKVKQGEVIDFVVTCRANEQYDGFVWAPSVTMKTASATTGGEMTLEWSATGEFNGPTGKRRPMGAWEKYAQVLLLANEFMFVD